MDEDRTVRKSYSQLTSEEIDDLILGLLNVIDYDIYKESLLNIEENGYDDLIDNLFSYLDARLK